MKVYIVVNSMFHFVNLTLLHNIGLAWANR